MSESGPLIFSTTATLSGGWMKLKGGFMVGLGIELRGGENYELGELGKLGFGREREVGI